MRNGLRLSVHYAEMGEFITHSYVIFLSRKEDLRLHKAGATFLELLWKFIAGSSAANMLAFLTRRVPMPTLLDPKLYYLLLNLCFCVAAWPRGKSKAFVAVLIDCVSYCA